MAWEITFTTLGDLICVLLFFTHVRYLRNWSYANNYVERDVLLVCVANIYTMF